MTSKCRICDFENEDDGVICPECVSYKEEDYDAYADEVDEEGE